MGVSGAGEPSAGILGWPRIPIPPGSLEVDLGDFSGAEPDGRVIVDNPAVLPGIPGCVVGS